MRKKLFIKNVMIMSVSALLIRCIGMLFSVKSAEIMGAETLGRFRLVICVYALFLLASTSGVGITVTRLAGDLIACKNDAQACFVRDRAAAFSLLLGAVSGILMLCTSFFLPGELFSSGSVNAVRILALSLPFAAFSSSMRGYFTARKKILRNSVEQLIEQLAEIAVFLLLCKDQFRMGLSPLFCAAAASCCAEIISFFYSAALLFIDRRKNTKPAGMQGLFSAAMPILIPCTASGALRSALSLIENCLIPAGLIKASGQGGQAMADYGIISGMALPWIMFPSVFIIPVSQLIVPEMSGARKLGQKKSIAHMSRKLIRVTVIYSLLAMLPFILFPYNIAGLLGYPEKAGFFMRVLALLIPLSFLDSIADGMLKGLDCQKSYFGINMIESVLRIIMALTLVPLFGAAGAAALIILGELVNVTLSLWKVISVCQPGKNLPARQ